MKPCLSFQYVVFTDAFLPAICTVSLFLRLYLQYACVRGRVSLREQQVLWHASLKSCRQPFKKKEGVRMGG